MDCLRETSVSRCANRSGKRGPIGGLGFPGKPGAYERATFALEILPYGVPIGNSVPGLRPGPALPTIIIPHPGALVKCFLNGKIKKSDEGFNPRRCTHPRRNLPTWRRSRRTLRRDSSFCTSKAVQVRPCSRDNPTR